MARSTPSLLLTGLLLLAVARDVPQWGAPWVYEDENWRGQILQDASLWRPPSRALTMQTYHWTWQYAGMEPAAYRAGNLALHLTAGVLVYGIGLQLVGPAASLVGAALYLLHPINSAASNYVTARAEVLATVFVVLAIWIAIRRTASWRWLPVGAALWLAGVSKETGMVGVPLLALTLLVWRPLAVRHLAFTPFWVALGAVCGATWASLRSWLAINPHAGGSWYGWAEFLHLQLTATWYLLSQIVTLQHFSIDHDILALGPRWTLVAVSLTVSAALAVAATWRRTPVVAWGLAWAGVALAPRFLFRTNEWLTEPQLYLALVGPCLLLGVVAVRLWQWSPFAEERVWWRDLRTHWAMCQPGKPPHTLKGLS